MKKLIALIFSLIFILGMFGCSPDSTQADYPAAILVDGIAYYLPTEPMSTDVDEEDIIGYTEAYTKKFPKGNGQTNFNQELGMPYARIGDGIAVFYKNEWYLCLPNE